MKAILHGGDGKQPGLTLFADLEEVLRKPTKDEQMRMDGILQSRFFAQIDDPEDAAPVIHRKGTGNPRLRDGHDNLRSFANLQSFGKHRLAPEMSQELKNELQLDEERSPGVHDAVM